VAETGAHTGFDDIDGSGVASDLIDYLRFVGELPSIRALKARSLEALALGPGMRVLDVGAGLGFDVCRFGERVGPSGAVIGVDNSRRMIASAEACRPEGLDHCRFEVGDAAALRFSDGCFDAVHFERLLQIHAAPTSVVAELVRVLKPGGRLVGVEPDWGTMAMDPGDPGVVRRLVDHCANAFPDGRTGRKLNRYFREAGLVDIRIEPETAPIRDLSVVMKAWNLGPFIDEACVVGVITRDERGALLDALARADRDGTFFFAMTAFRAIGLRPE
jgi:SAM-dependent methyltransferase